jgi:hypothetical protein
MWVCGRLSRSLRGGVSQLIPRVLALQCRFGATAPAAYRLASGVTNVLLRSDNGVTMLLLIMRTFGIVNALAVTVNDMKYRDGVILVGFAFAVCR